MTKGKTKMENHFKHSLPNLVAKGWLVETNQGYMLTPIGLEYYSVWSKSTKDGSEISKAIFSKTKRMSPDVIQEDLDFLFESKYICTVYDPAIGEPVIKSTTEGDTVFKSLEYYIDTERVNQDIDLNIKKIKKAHDSVRNQKMLSGLARGFEKTMTIATDMMVKIAKAQNPTAEPDVKTKKYKRRKAKPKQDEKPKEKEPPFGDMSKFWKS